MSYSETKSNSRGFNKDLTIVEKYQQEKKQTVAIRPYFDQENENMGLISCLIRHPICLRTNCLLRFIKLYHP